MRNILVGILACLCMGSVAGQAVEIEYADARDVPIVCSVRGHFAEVDDQIAGCSFWRNGIPRMVIPAGSKWTCVYWHELKHLYEGDWHAGRRASIQEGCDWRPPGFIQQ